MKDINIDLEKEFGEIEKQLSSLNMLNDMLSYSMPRSLYSGGTIALDLVARDTEYIQRHEMYRNKFVRLIVSLIIKNAIGSTVNNKIPYSIKINKDFEDKIPKKMQEMLEEEFKYLKSIIDKNFNEVLLDSQFYGDGYVFKIFEEKKGIVKLLSNFSTKALNVTPIVTNKDNTVAYEIANDNGIFNTKRNIFNQLKQQGRRYVLPFYIARMNAKSNGVTEPTLEQYSHIDNMNVFIEDELPYEDSIYGGVIEGTYEDFINFRWAIKALANTRIASSIIERFIIHNLGDLAKDEKDALKKALEKVLKDQIDLVKKRQKEKTPDVLISNHIIPTVGDNATNSVSIQESNPSFVGFQNIEDIMLHIKNFLGALGFSIELTPFGSGSVGGYEREGQIQNSMAMEESADNIRKTATEYIRDIVITHLIAKHNLKIDENIIDIEFTSVVNHSKMLAEQQRVEAVTNTQQVLGIVDQLKSQGYEDNEENRRFVFNTILSILPQDDEYREENAKALENIVFTKNETNEEGEL